MTVDAAAPLAPMSKYIYGQFIEHLGRCIYGGIWAEMLEDRKFFYPVAEGESPWTILGEPRSTAMTTARAFVGRALAGVRASTARAGRRASARPGSACVAGARYIGPRAARGELGSRADRGQPRLGRRAVRPADRHDPDVRRALPAVPDRVHGRGVVRRRAPGDRGAGQGPVPHRHRLAHAGRQRRRLPPRRPGAAARAERARATAGPAATS
ncbi:MAG: hypothetical protein MZV70_07870 [Desulfobacterales bacterium]|nr:hypothetical protein [Desulfobacterales bacterium]